MMWFEYHTTCPTCQVTYTVDAINDLVVKPISTCYSQRSALAVARDIERQMSLLYAQKSGQKTRSARKNIDGAIQRLDTTIKQFLSLV